MWCEVLSVAPELAFVSLGVQAQCLPQTFLNPTLHMHTLNLVTLILALQAFANFLTET